MLKLISTIQRFRLYKITIHEKNSKTQIKNYWFPIRLLIRKTRILATFCFMTNKFVGKTRKL